MIYVLAGSHHQFVTFCRRVGLNRAACCYVHSADQLRGRRRQFLIRVGTWRTINMDTRKSVIETAEYLNWRIEDWEEWDETAALRLRTLAFRSTQDLALVRSATL